MWRREDLVVRPSIGLFRDTLFRVALSAAALVLCPLGSSAEPSKPGDFFDKNYAQAPPLNVGGTGDNTSVSAPLGKPNTVQSPRTATQGTGASTTPLPESERTGVIEVYVNSADRNHLSTVLASIATTVRTRKTPITNVYHIGDYRNVGDDVKAQLKTLGVTIRASNALPSYLDVTQSPVWVIQTTAGRYVVEGATSIDRFLGTKGEFVVPAAPVAPTPGQKMEGF